MYPYTCISISGNSMTDIKIANNWQVNNKCPNNQTDAKKVRFKTVNKTSGPQESQEHQTDHQKDGRERIESNHSCKAQVHSS